MKRSSLIAIAAIGIMALLSLSAFAFASTPKNGAMAGVVVAPRNAALEVADQPGAGAAGSITVDRTFAPGDSWVVVHLDMDGKPGKRVGVRHVPAGESRGVTVALAPSVKLTDKLLVALHADRGVTGKFEFDMMRFESSPDKPYFVDGMELARAIQVK